MSSLRSTLRRRSAAAAGIYLSVGLGVAATIIAARQLGKHEFGLFSEVVVAAGFFQTLLDLTAEEALVKYGFDYTNASDWGRLRRLFRAALAVKAAGGLLAAAVLVALAPFAGRIFGAHGLETPFLVAAALPFAQCPEGVSSAALILHGRYDVRGAFLAAAMALRLAGIGIGAHFGVTEAVVGIVAAQAAATALFGAAGIAAFRRFPRAAHAPLGDHRRAILGFVVQSSLATGVVSLRGALAPVLLGVVASPAEVGFFRIAQAPQQGLASVSAPARLILLTEQTRDWSRGAFDVVLRGIRTYTLGASLLMVVLVPPVYAFMPELIRAVFGGQYAGATTAARLILVAGAIQFALGWTKSFPVSIGRPGLRVLAHGVESLVLVPLVVAFGSLWKATGAGGAVLASTAVFAALWSVLLARVRRDSVRVGIAAGTAGPSGAEAARL
ncbi:MAG TPA: lipopolysaccharide biosynthesis protein [Gaiellaceae bacterium]|nr:lipopolysaccharide biosynthesis protein [Gaiellaceae bacterium]